jgi:hypothetical protein
MLQIINFDSLDTTNNSITQDDKTYIEYLCKQSNLILHRIFKSHPHIIKDSCFVFADRTKSFFGINTESWHCISITPATLFNIDKHYRTIICDLIIFNINDVITQYKLTGKSIYGISLPPSV